MLPLFAAALFLATAAHAQQQPAGPDWWKKPSGNRLDQRVIAPSGEAGCRLKWDDGYIECRAGGTADPALAVNLEHEKSLALDAARAQAYYQLLEVVEGVAIDGVTTVKNAMVVDQTVSSRVQGRVRGAVLVSQDVRGSRGSVWAEVVIGLRLNGSGGLGEPVLGWAASRPADPYRGDSAFRVNDRYTGLIVEASDVSFSPALAPRVVETGTGKVVFGPHLVQPAALSQGPIGYFQSMADARAGGRAGANPLIVRAIGPTGGRKGDLALSAADAERVLAADREGRFLERAAVAVVQGKEPRELVAQPGRTYALVVGVNDYRYAGTGGLTKLNFASRDAQVLGSLLASRAAVDVVIDQQATRAGILSALESLKAKAKDEDTVILFFSGHGSTGPGPDGRPHYFLLPQDGRLDALPTTGVSDQDLEERVGQIGARQMVVIIDACFSGAGGSVIRARGVTNPAATAQPTGRALVEASSGRVVMSASRPDQVAFEDDQRGGVFTSFLLEGLRGAADANNDGVVTVLELYEFVSPRVREFSRQRYQVEQTPVLEVRELSGAIALARR